MTTVAMDQSPQIVVVGQLGATYGVHGWLKIYPATEDRERIFDYQPWLIKQGTAWHPIELVAWKHHNQNLIVKLRSIDDRESAQIMVNLEIAIEAKQLPPLPCGEYYWNDLIGCPVVTLQGTVLGDVISLMETGANDVLVVKPRPTDSYYAKERLIPWIEKQVVKRIDLSMPIIEVDWDPEF